MVDNSYIIYTIYSYFKNFIGVIEKSNKHYYSAFKVLRMKLLNN